MRIALAAAIAALILHAPDSKIDAGFQDFFTAGSPHGAQKAADRLVKDGVDFDTAFARLKRGRTYGRAATGLRAERISTNGLVFENAIDVPDDYDPAQPIQVRVQLHGGIGRAEPQPLQRRQNRIAGERQIYVYPTGWVDAAWWNVSQVENILALVDRVKRTYNVDEARVYLTGISDGGTGVYYLAMRAPTIWSACLPLNGSIAVLANARVGAEGELFVGNLVNRPFFVVNGGQDPLYPATYIAPTIDLMRRAGVPLTFRPQPDAGHDTSWWPAERDVYERFVREHPRAPYPERLSWETERTDRANRIDWLVIDALGAASGETPLEDVNTPEAGDGPARQLFTHRGKSGRVDLVRHGNTIDAKTRGVRAFTLLLSPDAVDFSAPVRVTVNGREAFQGRVEKSVATLLKWAAEDNDRTRLYAAELKINP